MKKFKLRAIDSKKYFTVMVYDDLKELRKDANKISENNDDLLGVCHPFERKQVKPDGSMVDHDQIGIIRLHKGHLSSHIVFHETMHGALWQYRLTQPKELANFGKSCGEKEEEFLHLAGKLYMDMIRKMYKHKLWS